MLGLIVEFIQYEIMITGDDYFVFVRQLGEEITEAVQLAAVRILGEVSRVDEDVGGRQLGQVEFVVAVVGVRHGDDTQRHQHDPIICSGGYFSIYIREYNC